MDEQRVQQIRARIDTANARHAGCHRMDCASILETCASVADLADLADLLDERDRLLAVYRWADYAIDVMRQDSDSDLDEWFIERGIAAVRAYRAATTGDES